MLDCAKKRGSGGSSLSPAKTHNSLLVDVEVRIGKLHVPLPKGHPDRQTERQADRQAGRQTGRQADGQAGRQTDRQSSRQAGTQADRQWTPLSTYAGDTNTVNTTSLTNSRNNLMVTLFFTGTWVTTNQTQVQTAWRGSKRTTHRTRTSPRNLV